MKYIISISILLVFLLIVFIPFLSLDWVVGEHGRLTITSVDKRLFGTYKVYARNSDSLSGDESLEVIYCIDKDDQDIVNLAKSAVGKKNTKLIYPKKRVGFYWFDKCHSAPIKNIIVSE